MNFPFKLLLSSGNQVPGRPIPRSTPVIAAVTPTIDKRRVAPRTGI